MNDIKNNFFFIYFECLIKDKLENMYMYLEYIILSYIK